MLDLEAGGADLGSVGGDVADIDAVVEAGRGSGSGIAAVAVVLPALALAACGGGSEGAAPSAAAPSAPVTVVPAAVTTAQASRFLAQSTMGATRTMIDAVVARGYSGWIDDQFAMARATSHRDWLVANGYNVAANINAETGFDATMWRQVIAEPDQLRQRVGIRIMTRSRSASSARLRRISEKRS